MTLDPSRIGLVVGPSRVSWTTRESMLYALAVGAGQQDPLGELAMTTENSRGVAQQVIPTFASVLGFGDGLPDVGDYDPTRAVHAEEQVWVERPLPAAGEVEVTTTVTDMWDKGRDALLWTETILVDAASGERLATCRTGAFLGGAGGFGGRRGGSLAWEAPSRQPDVVVTLPTRPDQALLYRLTGDRNPLHSDPSFAADAGFPRPILHGMCTFGFTARALIHSWGGGDATRLRAVSGRFTSPVLPGETLTVQVWGQGAQVWFRTLRSDGTVVIDRGCAHVVQA